MIYTFEDITIAGRTCSIYFPSNLQQKAHGVLYVHDAKQFISTFYELAPKLNPLILEHLPIIVAIHPINRLDEYTPWPNEALHPKFAPFGGLGDTYLKTLAEEIKPYIDTHYNTLSAPEHTGILGFSLGGLISLYAAYTRKEFGIIASLSGSFWYAGWDEFINTHTLIPHNPKIYLSSGRDEGANKDNRMKHAAHATIATQKTLSYATGKMINVRWDEGGHHDFRLERHMAALEWISQTFR